MEELKLLPNETENHFVYRVYKYQEDTGSLTNKECAEICNRELNLNNDESAYRKRYQSFCLIFNDIKHELVSSERLEEIDKREEELYKTKVKTNDKLREYRKTLRDEARIENLKETAIESAKIIAQSNPIIIKKSYIPNNDKVAMIQLGDWHFSNIVKNYWNNYDVEEFYRRIEKLTNDVISYCDVMGVRSISVLNGNDLVNGIIHVSTRILSEEDIITQTQYVSEALAKMLSVWAEHFNTVDYYSVLDNHGRTTANKKEHIEKENFSRFIDWFLEARLSNVDNLVIHQNEYDRGIAVVDIFGQKAFLVHGHQDRLSNMVQNLTLMLRIFPIAVFTNHLHHNYEDEVHKIDLIMNCSLEGTDDYAVGIRCTSLARQKMTIFENCADKVKRLATFYIEF